MQLQYFKDVVEWSKHCETSPLLWEHDYFPSNQQLAEGDEPTDQNIVIIARSAEDGEILGVFDCDMNMGVAVARLAHDSLSSVEQCIKLISEYRDAG